jgi:hypothetical protein
MLAKIVLLFVSTLLRSMTSRPYLWDVNSIPREYLAGPGWNPSYQWPPQVENASGNLGIGSTFVGCTPGSGGSSLGQQIHPNYFPYTEFHSQGYSFHADSLPLPPRREMCFTTVSAGKQCLQSDPNAKKSTRIKDSPKKEARAKVSSSSPKTRRTKAKDNEGTYRLLLFPYILLRGTNV